MMKQTRTKDTYRVDPDEFNNELERAVSLTAQALRFTDDGGVDAERASKRYYKAACMQRDHEIITLDSDVLEQEIQRIKRELRG